MGELNDRINDLNKKAYDIFQTKRYSEVIPIVEELIEIIPKEDPHYRHFLGYAYSNLGYNYYRMENKEKSEPLLKKAIETDNTIVQAYQTLLDMYIKQDRNLEAMDLGLEAIKNNPCSSAAWTNNGQVWIHIGQPEEALKSLERAVALNNNNMVAWSYFARTYNDIGDFDRSFNAVKETYRASHYSKLEDELERRALIDAMQVDSGLSMFLGRLDETFEACERLKKFEPTDPWSYTIEAFALRVRHDLIESLNIVDEGLQVIPDSDALFFVRALNTFDLNLKKDYEKALSKIKTPMFFHAANARGLLLEEKFIESLDESLKSLQNTHNREKYAYEGLAYTEIRVIINQAIEGYIKKNSFPNLIAEVKKSITDKENLTSINYVLSALVEYSGLEQKYVKMSQELFRDALRRKPDSMKTPSVTSKNVVRVIAANRVAKNLYMIKTFPTDTPENRIKLEREYHLTRYVHSILGPRSSEAILLEQPYFMEKWIHSPSMIHVEKYEEKDVLVRELKNCILTMTQLHNYAFPIKNSEEEYQLNFYDSYDEKDITIPLKKYDFGIEMSRRFSARIGQDTSSLIQSYNEMLSGMDLEEYLLHGDAFKGNWLKGGISIDWERACVGDPIIDLVQLINDIDFCDINKREMIDEYIEKKQDFFGFDSNISLKLILPANCQMVHSNPNEGIGMPLNRIENQSPKAIYKKFDILSIHDSICNIGTKIDRKDESGRNAYIEQAIRQSEPYPKLQRELINTLAMVGLVR